MLGSRTQLVLLVVVVLCLGMGSWTLLSPTWSRENLLRSESGGNMMVQKSKGVFSLSGIWLQTAPGCPCWWGLELTEVWSGDGMMEGRPSLYSSLWLRSQSKFFIRSKSSTCHCWIITFHTFILVLTASVFVMFGMLQGAVWFVFHVTWRDYSLQKHYYM